MDTNLLDTHQKAVQINLDNTKYGTFAEIGAGQEVARWFFRVGGAAGTIAKSISAYDMTVSDAIYGASGRYVSRQRLETMLHYEFGLMTERLAAKRGENTRFFVFADTIAAKSYSRKDNFHGWMGIRFQNRPGADPSQILLHVSLLDRETTLQQEAVGILGVNLVHAALYEAAPVALCAAPARQPVQRADRCRPHRVHRAGLRRGGQSSDESGAGPLRADRGGHVHRRGEGRPAGRGVLQAADPGRPRPVPARSPTRPST